MRALLSDFFITLRINNLENISPFEMLRVFVKTLTADDKYPVRDSENLRFSIQTQFFVPF